MNITDQIIKAAYNECDYWISEKERKTSSILNKKKLKNIYQDWYDEIAVDVHESEYAIELLIRDILVYDSYESIASFIHHNIYPVDTLAEIEFRENTTVDFDYEYNKVPIVKMNYDFSRDHEEGIKITKYISKLFLLREIKKKLGYDVNLYPEKCYALAFKHDNVVYVWESGRDRNMRLTIDKSANQEILDVYYEVLYTQTKNYDNIYSLLDGLPFLVGQEAQQEFDILWYRKSKQIPLTYRCFPNTYTMDFSFSGKKICRHKGEYCIKREKIDSRYERFVELLEALDEDEKEELIKDTIDYLEDFISNDCFDKGNHKHMYEILLVNVKMLTKESREMCETTSKILASAFEKWKEDGYLLNPLAPYIKDFKPRFSIFDYGNEDNNEDDDNDNDNVQPLARRLLHSKPNWELIQADMQETREERRKEQIEIAKIALKEVLEEQNIDQSDNTEKSNKDEHIINKKAYSLSCKQIALIHIYENKEQITRKNADIIAAKYGYKSPNSGEGLFQDYNLYSSHSNRTGLPNPFTIRKMENKIKLFNGILQHLTKEAKEQAKKDIDTLEIRLAHALENL